MRHITGNPITNCLLGAALIIVAGCGGGDTSSSELAGTGSSTTVPAPASTSAPTSSIESAGPFEAAVDEAFIGALALADLRMACFEQTDLSCITATEEELVAAETAVAAALETVGALSVEAGVDPVNCQDRVTETVENNVAERLILLERATVEARAGNPFFLSHWDYFRDKSGRNLATPGHAIASVLIQCTKAVNSPDAGPDLAFWLKSFVDDSDFARSAFASNLWTQYACVDQPPSNPNDPERTCYQTYGTRDDVGLGRGRLEGAYENLSNSPGYADMSQECRSAIEEANTRLMSSLEIFNDLYERELVSTDAELQSLLSRGVFQIDDQRRGTAPMYPFDEAIALNCVAAVIAQL